MEEEICSKCKHYEWNIIGVDENRRPGTGRCFNMIDTGEWPWGAYYRYHYEKCFFDNNDELKSRFTKADSNSEEE